VNKSCIHSQQCTSNARAGYWAASLPNCHLQCDSFVIAAETAHFFSNNVHCVM